MLETLFGIIECKLDNEPIEYKFVKVSTDRACADLNGRYALFISFSPDGQEHKISCTIPENISVKEICTEPGERIEINSFYIGTSKLSIGLEADTVYVNGKRISSYDYDSEVIERGVQYIILPDTKTELFVFGVVCFRRLLNQSVRKSPKTYNLT